MGKAISTGIQYRFLIFLAAWLVLVGVLWGNYQEWIVYDWGLPLLPWIAVLIGVYGVEAQLAAAKKRRRKKNPISFQLKFWKDICKQSFLESWYGLRLELIIIIATSLVFTTYYLVTL